MTLDGMSLDGALPPELAAAERLDEILGEFAAYPQPIIQNRVVELLRCVDQIHRPGLMRLAELLESAGLLDAALDDPPARLLLGLYGLDLGADDSRLADELPGGGLPLEAERSSPDAGRLAGGSRVAMALPLATAPSERSPQVGRAWQELPIVTSAPHAVPAPVSGFVPLSSIKINRPPRLAWRAAFRADQVPPGKIGAVQVEGEFVLVANLDGELRAYRNACPGSPLPLHGGPLEGSVLECPWHHCRFDLRDGARLDASGPGLSAMPVSVEEGVVRIGTVERQGA